MEFSIERFQPTASQSTVSPPFFLRHVWRCQCCGVSGPSVLGSPHLAKSMAIPQPELDSMKVENKARPSVTFSEDASLVGCTGEGSRAHSHRASSRPSLLTGAGYAAEMTPARMPLTLEQRAARIKLMDMCYASAEGAEGELISNNPKDTAHLRERQLSPDASSSFAPGHLKPDNVE